MMGEIRKTTPQSMNEKLTAADCCRYAVGVELGFQGRDTSRHCHKGTAAEDTGGPGASAALSRRQRPWKPSLSRANPPVPLFHHPDWEL